MVLMRGGMKRREFIGLVGGAAAALIRAAHAQSGQIRRVALIVAEAIEDDPEYERRLLAFSDALRDLGWIDGQNLKLSVHRVKPGIADIRNGVAELLAENPDIIVSGGGTTTLPVLQATSSIPVVFATAVDPVGNGFVESLSHPGGNATGFMQFDYSLSAKWLELLKQASPSTVRVGVIRDAAAPSGTGQFAVIQSVAGSVGVDVVPISARDASEIESGMARLARFPNAGLIATAGAAVIGNRDLIIRLAVRYRFPAVYASRTYLDHGGLISYGADPIRNYRSAADYVDRILKGARPADLPVQAPNKYDLVVNLKTAKALGLELPATVIARADEVIE
jgi:putative tryptophan/tyrosine transport system substrate-binding protein